MYGQWLPGDQRAWRERHHRKHIDGDYKHPLPMGKFEGLHDHSKEIMNRDPVELSSEQRVSVCKAFHAALIERKIEVAELSVGARHWHGLLRFNPIDQVPTHARDPKLLVGQAKGKCAHTVSTAGIVARGGIWAQGCRTLPIADQRHFDNSRGYIHDHIHQGAAVISELIQLWEPPS
jgi:hypothetical protein